MSNWRTPVFFGLDERRVDELLDYLCDLQALPGRCLVFGTSMNSLGALVGQWAGQIDVVTALLPRANAEMVAFAEAIARREGMVGDAAVWVCDDGLLSASADLTSASLNTSDQSTRDVAERLAKCLPRS